MCVLVQVLQCISQLEMAQLIGTGVKTRYITHSSSPLPNKRSQRSTSYTAKSTSHIDSVLSGGDAKKMASIQEQVTETSSQSVVVAVDRIFTGSTRLNTNAIGEI